MLDTNICIYAIKRKPEEVFINLKKHEPSELCISSVSYAELVYGVEKSAAAERNRLALSLLLANIEILRFDNRAAEAYGKLRAELEKARTPIGPLDTMIAAHAIAEDCVLVTNNLREFRRVKVLNCEDWSLAVPAY